MLPGWRKTLEELPRPRGWEVEVHNTDVPEPEHVYITATAETPALALIAALLRALIGCEHQAGPKPQNTIEKNP